MKAFFRNELTRLFLFVVICLVIAAIFTPYVYTWGKNLAAEGARGELSGTMEWLAEKCDRAKFSRYFNRVLMAAAIILLYPFIRLMRSDRQEIRTPLLKRLNPQKQGWKDMGIGFMLAAGYMALFVIIAFSIGWIVMKGDAKISSIVLKATTPAIITSLLEEWLFRGVLFALLLRTLSVKQAIIGLSLFFAAVHFLKPPVGIEVSNGHNAMAGFELLGLIGQKYMNPGEFFGFFLTLFFVGVVLAYARHYSSALWLPIGLHSGWIFCLKFTDGLFYNTGVAHPALLGMQITVGLVPIVFVILTGFSVYYYLKPKSLDKPI